MSRPDRTQVRQTPPALLVCAVLVLGAWVAAVATMPSAPTAACCEDPAAPEEIFRHEDPHLEPPPEADPDCGADAAPPVSAPAAPAAPALPQAPSAGSLHPSTA